MASSICNGCQAFLKSLPHEKREVLPLRSSLMGKKLLSNGSFKSAISMNDFLKVESNRNKVTIESALLTKETYGSATAQGTGRAVYEDSLLVSVDETGKSPSFFGVYDGHGGPDVAIFLQKALWPAYKSKLSSISDPRRATVSAFEEVDAETIAAPKGLFGALRERGIGGSRCGSTAATLVLLPGEKWQLLAANVGDSRIVLSRGGKAIQLTVDHKPDVVAERIRIEAKNPTPKKPLVQNVGGIWRVGGLLALSRAFGDVYLKDWSDGLRDGARGGFGLTAEPTLWLEELQEGDNWAIVGTDGLWEFISNEEAVDFCLANQQLPLNSIADRLLKLAVSRGTTDDVTVIVIKLPETVNKAVEV